MRQMFRTGPDDADVRYNPITSSLDTLRTLMAALGFPSIDNGYSPEVIACDNEYPPFECAHRRRSVMLQDGGLSLRTWILPQAIARFDGELPRAAICCGAIYDQDDAPLAKRYRIEGYLSGPELNERAVCDLWQDFGVRLFGLGTYAYLRETKERCSIVVLEDRCAEKKHEFIEGGCAAPELKAALGLEEEMAWAFSIDVDAFAVEYYEAEREELYSTDPDILEKWSCPACPTAEDALHRLANALRWLGYTEYHCAPFYPRGIYKKEHMIQEKWDTNNAPFNLNEPMGDNVSFATVLTPGLEDTLSVYWKAGRAAARIFEIGHVAKPDAQTGGARERLVLAFGGYGDGLDIHTFVEDAGKVLARAGLVGEMFFPTDKAIAYKADECYILLDSKNGYLESNLGQMHPIAERNWGIGTQAYMAFLEIEAIAAAANEMREEY